MGRLVVLVRLVVVRRGRLVVFLLLVVEGEVEGGEVGGVDEVFLLAPGILHIVDNFRTPVTVGSQPLQM